MIKNYSTEVPPERTIGEITKLLVEKGATSITSLYGPGGILAGVHFVLEIGRVPVTFELPVNREGVYNAIMRDKPWNRNHRVSRSAYEVRVRGQAGWVAWRILKDWIEAQMALIESNQAETGQVFMPYALSAGQDTTMYAAWVDNNQKQLGSGS